MINAKEAAGISAKNSGFRTRGEIESIDAKIKDAARLGISSIRVVGAISQGCRDALAAAGYNIDDVDPREWNGGGGPSIVISW